MLTLRSHIEINFVFISLCLWARLSNPFVCVCVPLSREVRNFWWELISVCPVWKMRSSRGNLPLLSNLKSHTSQSLEYRYVWKQVFSVFMVMFFFTAKQSKNIACETRVYSSDMLLILIRTARKLSPSSETSTALNRAFSLQQVRSSRSWYSVLIVGSWIWLDDSHLCFLPQHVVSLSDSLIFPQVRYMKIIEKSGYQALPWVRYITQSGGKLQIFKSDPEFNKTHCAV